MLVRGGKSVVARSRAASTKSAASTARRINSGTIHRQRTMAARHRSAARSVAVAKVAARAIHTMRLSVRRALVTISVNTASAINSARRPLPSPTGGGTRNASTSGAMSTTWVE